MRILIIDDEDSMRHMLSVILRREGYEPVSVAEAERALDLLGADDFDFILCDIKMPGLDGLAFLKALKDRGLARTVIMRRLRDVRNGYRVHEARRLRLYLKAVQGR